MGNKNSHTEVTYEKVPQSTPRPSVSGEVSTKITECETAPVSEPMKKCDICETYCPNNKISLYKIYYAYCGVCESCHIKDGRSHQFISEKNYNISTKCYLCHEIKECTRITLYIESLICAKCYIHYTSSERRSGYHMDLPKSKYCCIKKCGKELDNNSKTYYDNKVEKHICVKCFISYKGTSEEIVNSMTNTTSENDNAPTEIHPVSYIVPHGATSRVLHINKFSPGYVKEWSCMKENCAHPGCNFCYDTKHVFLSKITVCDNRIDMCLECWTKFDNAGNNIGNNEIKKD